jgi:hypothetical protein
VAAASSKDRPYGDRQLVIFRGGFRDKWVYFEADALAEQAATEAQGRAMVYAPTPRREPHPLHPSYICQVWEFTDPVDGDVGKPVGERRGSDAQLTGDPRPAPRLSR